MRIVLLGPPGSGKAELSQKMSEHFGMPVITVNSVMQRAAAEPSELGRLAKEAMEQSRVSDELLLALLRIQVPQMDLSRGFVLVDFPKNAGQADVLDSMLSDLGAGIEIVLNLDVDPDELMERLVGRITCDSCGAQYNLYVNPPMVDGVCDACGARVVRRPDDYEETISNRLRVYEGQMGPLLQYYQLNDKLRRVEADRGVDQAWKTVSKLIKSLPPSVPPEKPSPVEPEKRPAQQKTVQTQKTAGKAQSVTKTSKRAAARPAKAEKAPPAKKTPAKSAAKKAASKPLATEKKPAKPPAGKTASKKKAVANKTAAKKPAKKAEKKKSAVKKAAATKPVRKSPAKKKAGAKAQKKTAAKKAPVKKSPVKRKVTTKKAAPKKPAAKRTSVKKKATQKRPATQKTSVKKAAAKKAAAKKKTVVKAKKKARRP